MAKRSVESKLRVFFDADVLFRAAWPKTPRSAPNILFKLSTLTLIEAVYSPYVRDETRRNILRKLPEALQPFLTLIATTLKEVPDAPLEVLKRYTGRAHPKDTPVLAAAHLARCRYLLTGNVKHYPKPPRGLKIMDPGRLVKRIRDVLASL